MDDVIERDEEPEEDPPETWHIKPYFNPRRYWSDAGSMRLEIQDYDADGDERSIGLPFPDTGSFGLDLHPGISPEMALEIAEYLQENIRFLTYTGPVPKEFADLPGRVAIGKRERKRDGENDA